MLTASLAAQKSWTEELTGLLAAQKAWTEELNASFTAEVARTEELRAILHDRECRIADLGDALERQAVEMARQRDTLGAELEAVRFQAMLGTPKWLVRRALLKGAFLGLSTADRALGWMHAGLRLRLRYVAGLIYDRRYHELSVLLRSKFGAPATAAGEAAVPARNGTVAEPPAPPVPVPAAAPAALPAAVPVAFMGGEAFEAEISGWLNPGWYGSRELEAGERFWTPPAAADRAGPDARYEEGRNASLACSARCRTTSARIPTRTCASGRSIASTSASRPPLRLPRPRPRGPTRASPSSRPSSVISASSRTAPARWPSWSPTRRPARRAWPSSG
ncbi:hypothetical protein [Azospirillum brasilense]|uniref:hypothetical protein n=1 Tax=Azospirillum brasilense TaxID=192 RepID=UPI001FE82F2D|nr:hypothetical protein [Azospirillum brasilense]